MGLGGQRHAPAALPPGKRPCTILQGRSRRVPPGFNPRNVHPVAKRYTDWAIAAHKRKCINA
jgi:hypothetical protein